MKRISFILCIILLATALPAHAQRSIAASKSFSDFRSVGELRVWTFLMKDSVIGRLSSKVIGTKEINGENAYILEEKLYLDYNKVGSPVLMDIKGERYVNEKGYYCGDNTSLTINNQSGQIDVTRKDKTITGYVSRGKTKQKQEIQLGTIPFAIDNDYFDQYELYFALHDLQVGDTIDDSIFVPQTMLMTRIQGKVQAFSYQQLHRTLFDSVFVIRLTEPQPLELFFTADKRLLKINNHNQKLRVYLDVVRNEQMATQQKSAFTTSKILTVLPRYFVLLLVGIIIWFVLNGTYRWDFNLVPIPVLGIVLYILVIFVQLPFQEYLFRQIFVPLVKAGNNVFFSAILTVLPSGIVQEGLKLLGIYLVVRFYQSFRDRYFIIGGLIGLGFGLMEGWYISTIVDSGGVLSWWLWERTAMIVFHTITGVLLGYAYGSQKIKTVVVYYVLLVGVDIILKSFPVFIQQGKATAQLMNIVLAIIVVLLLLVALIALRQPRLHTQKSK